MNRKEKWLLAGAGAAALTGAQLVVLGALGGRGPLGFLQERRRAKLPGNGPAYSFDKIERLPASPLDGKTVCFLGSSVTYGAASLQCSLPEYFAARTGCTVIKEAVSGTTLADHKSDSYVSRLKKLDPGAKIDLLICQLSTNDASNGVPLGEISDGPYDTATVTGAIEEIITWAKKTWGCKIAFYTGARFDSPAYAAMVRRLYEIAEKWEVGVLDLWSDKAFNTLTRKQRSLYMSDPVHPTKAGYRDWWCPELERQLFRWLEKQKSEEKP